MRIFEMKDWAYASIRKEFDMHPTIKFSAVLILIVGYMVYAAQSHGLKDGFLISILSWSFFVLCTPVADAGILIDFPMRLITGIRMVYSEMVVWGVAITLNIIVFFKIRSLYEKTILLSLFKYIISKPIPNWSIIVLSAIGTFLSVYIADNFVGSRKGKKEHANFIIKHKIIIFVLLILLVLTIYNFLLKKLGVKIPLL